ncbi:MAG: hypothetical protein IJY88_01120, partial [Clostridia bacterium]|nr:hypothetical protein [Clostridia bacterium]
ITPCPEGTCTYQNGICSLCGGYQAAEKISESHYPEYNSTHSGYYAIENAGQLRWFGSNCNTSYHDTPVNAVLVANITDNEKVTENGTLISDVSGLREWTPLGSGLSGYFYGIFDGNGKYISGLYKSNDSGNAALFDDNSGTIKNLTLKDTYFRADGTQASRAGAFAVTNDGTIENCASYAIISGKYPNFVGMFAGLGTSDGKITSSFAAYPMIINSSERYSFYGTDSSSASDANITKSYYLSNGTGLREKTAEEFANGSVAYLLGDAWGQDIGTDLFPVLGGAKIYTSYPCVKEYSNTPFAVENSHSFENLVCTYCGESQLLATEDNYAELGVTSDYIGYFVISNVDHFIWLSEHISKGNKDANVILTADMDFTGKSWTPITEFSGTFDGGGHRIKNLRVNLTASNSSFAIFAALSDGAVIRNLVIDSSSSIFSTGSTGALAYSVLGSGTITIENCGNEANISSNGYTAGLIRYDNVSARVNLKNCYNTGAISGNSVKSVSGLVQGGFYNTFINCYNI